MKKLLALVLILLVATSASALDVRELIRKHVVISHRVATVLDVPATPQIANGGKTCQITGAEVANATSYRLYRGYGLDKTLIDTQASYAFEVEDNVLGSPQYYCVQAVGAGGELSGFSAEAMYWPVSTLTLRSPCYMLMQWRDYPDVLLTQAQIDTMATFDVIGEGSHFYEGGGTIELAYGTKAGGNDLVTRVRTKATAVDGHHVAFISYLFGNAARLNWSTQQESHPYVSPYVFGPYPSSGNYSRNDVHPRIWDWCVANDGFLKNKDTGQPLINPVYPVYNYNYGNPDMPAALAEIYVDGFEGSAMDGEYCGFLYDFINTDVQGWTCDRTKVDLDGDGIAYTNDSADEAEIYRQWHLNVVKALRREFAERGMDNRLIVVNGNGVQNSAINSSAYGELSQWVDGFMQERWNDGTIGYPGWRSATDLTAAWQAVTGEYCNPDAYPHAQTRPYGFIWHVYADTELPYMSAVPAIATNGWAHGNDPGKNVGCSASGDACYVRGCNGEVRISDPLTRMPTPGAISSVLIQEKPIPPGDTFCDTLTVVAANLKSRLALRPVGTTKGSWPYIYTQKGDDGYYGTADDVIVARHSSWPLATVNVTAADGSSTWTNDTSHTITGTGFGATKTGSCKVEIGNNPYYGSCTVKDEQSTTAWGSTSITLTYSVSTGEPVTGWLYVTDSAGSVSPAWKVTRDTTPPPPEGAPNITGFSGVDDIIEDLHVYDITGVDFGTKPTAAPLFWEDAEGGTFNPGWTTTQQLTVGTQSRHGSSSGAGVMNFLDYDKHGYFTGGSNSPKWFCQYWFKLDPDFDWGSGTTEGVLGANLSNVKFFRMWDTGSSNEDFVVATEGWGGSCIWTVENVAAGNVGWFEGDYKTNWTKNVWHLFQFEYMDGDLGQTNGVFRMWRDGQLVLEKTNLLTREDYSAYKRPLVLGFYNSWGDPGTDDDHFYIDDVYSDTSWARVEIGDASTYSACTHREIQLPIAWSSTSITIDSRLGSFGAGEYYLFVVDENGTPSSGYPIYVE